MGHYRSGSKFNLYLVAIGVLSCAAAVVALRPAESPRKVSEILWEAAKAAATSNIQDTMKSSVHPVFSDNYRIVEYGGVYAIESWVDINGQLLEWEAHLCLEDGKCELMGVLIDPKGTQETIDVFNEITQQLTSG